MDSQYLTLGEAAKLAPSRPSISAIWRWCRRGVRVAGSTDRVKLGHVRSGRAIYTTREDLEAFIRALADADSESSWCHSSSRASPARMPVKAIHRTML